MSVMLYEDVKFLRIYESLQRKGRNIAHLWHYPKGWDSPNGMDDVLKDFVNDLRRANTITWNRQYQDEQYPLNILELTGMKQVYKDVLPYKNDFELLKSLRGLRYNLISNDGNETDLLGCMKKLDDLVEYVALDIIDRLPEWERADTW